MILKNRLIHVSAGKLVSRMGLFLAATLLVGCVGVPSFSPEQAVVKDILQTSQDPMSVQVNPESVRVLQSQQIDDFWIVTATSQGIIANTKQGECVYAYEVQPHRLLGWVVSSGGSSCGEIRKENNQPITIGISGGGLGGVELQPSYAYGLVLEEQIVTVEVIWDNDQIQQVEVINGSYLVIRMGSFEDIEIRALDAEGQVVYTFEFLYP